MNCFTMWSCVSIPLLYFLWFSVRFSLTFSSHWLLLYIFCLIKSVRNIHLSHAYFASNTNSVHVIHIYICNFTTESLGDVMITMLAFIVDPWTDQTKHYLIGIFFWLQNKNGSWLWRQRGATCLPWDCYCRDNSWFGRQRGATYIPCYDHAMAAHLARNLNRGKFKNNFMNTSPGIHVQVLQPSLPLAPNTYLDLHVIIHSLVPVHVDCLCCTMYVTCCFWCCGCTTYVTCCFWGFGFTTCTVCTSEIDKRLLWTGRTRKCILFPPESL